MSRKADQLKEQAQELQNALDTASGTDQHHIRVSEFNFPRAEKEALENKINHLNKELFESREAIRLSDQAVDQETQKLHALLDEIKAIQLMINTDNESLLQENEALQRQLAEINKKLADSKQNLREKDEQLQQQVQEVQKLQEALCEFKHQCESLNEVNTSLMERNEALQRELVVINISLAHGKQALGQKDQQLQQQAQEVQTTQEALGEVKHQYVSLCDINTSLTDKNEALEIKVQQLTKKLSVKEEEIRLHNQALQQEIQMFQEILADLQDFNRKYVLLKVQAENEPSRNLGANKMLCHGKKSIQDLQEETQHLLYSESRDEGQNEEKTEGVNASITEDPAEKALTLGTSAETSKTVNLNQNLQQQQLSPEDLHKECPCVAENPQKQKSYLLINWFPQTLLKMYKTGTMRYWVEAWYF
ncbi:hypothetical protein ILYODFUR_025901 [Ilyodon furcidens]|uniref:Uncharacterized protein n=1 Tax=Ilyodon furcidens TaxID=33524 RepID=A0ABV0TZ01_9TELE